jgi:hypothetical protein
MSLLYRPTLPGGFVFWPQLRPRASRVETMIRLRDGNDAATCFHGGCALWRLKTRMDRPIFPQYATAKNFKIPRDAAIDNLYA